MKIKSFSVSSIPPNVRKLPEEKRRWLKEHLPEQLASGALSLGEGVRLMRLAAGMTQVQYAEMAGVDLRVLAAVEKDNGNPQLDTLQKLGKPYGLTVSFVKPQSSRIMNAASAEERFGTENESDELRRIAAILEKMAVNANTPTGD
jgi:putative transcriptional regulator